LVATGWEVRYAPELDCRLWRREKSLVRAGNLNPIPRFSTPYSAYYYYYYYYYHYYYYYCYYYYCGIAVQAIMRPNFFTGLKEE
jgi:hypothetical protein